MDVLVLKSSRDDGVLEVRRDKPDWWVVSLALPRLRATKQVDSAPYRRERLAAFFRRLADDWRGWSDAREWGSIEGDLELEATHDGLGHVALRVRLRNWLDPEWQCEGVIWLDAGQLESVVREAERIDPVL